MKPIPCKENKCILLPVCLQKKSLFCDDLLHWFQAEDKRYKVSPWGVISKVLPTLQYIDSSPHTCYKKR